jgi:hypothetical protein
MGYHVQYTELKLLNLPLIYEHAIFTESSSRVEVEFSIFSAGLFPVNILVRFVEYSGVAQSNVTWQHIILKCASAT